jgi:hypothetical protein
VELFARRGGRSGIRVLAPILAALALAACGSGSSSEPHTAPPPAAATGPGITIKQAVAANTNDPLLVRGALVAEGSTIRLCYAVLESYPPQCGKPALIVRGLDLESLEGLTMANGVTWSDGEVKLLGTVADASLTVSGTAVA